MNSLDPQISLDLRTTTADLTAPVVARSDVVVVGGGPAGVAAAVAAARNGARVTLLERYPHLGGLASGGMVLVLDDMINGQEITVTRHRRRDDRPHDRSWAWPSRRRRDGRQTSEDCWNKWVALGHLRLPHPQPDARSRSATPPRSTPTAGSASRTRWSAKPASTCACTPGSPAPIVEERRIKGVICETKQGRQAILGDVVIDATGDLDVALPAGAPLRQGQLHRHDRVPPRRRRHRRRRAFEQAQPEGGPGARPRGQAHHGRLLGAVVAQDAAARRRLVQLPAHDRLSTASTWRT